MAISDPYQPKPVEPTPWDPTCPACLSGTGPVIDPNDPIVKIAEPDGTA